MHGGGECSGCMSCKEPLQYYCPICGEEVHETVFVDLDGDVVGCENCVERKDVWEVMENEAD